MYRMCKWQTYIYYNNTLLYFQPPYIKFGGHDLKKKNSVLSNIFFTKILEFDILLLYNKNVEYFYN